MKKFYHKYNRKTWLVLVFTIIIALVSLKFLPSQLPIHFDTQGNPDNFAGKWSIFLAPFIILLLLYSFCSSFINAFYTTIYDYLCFGLENKNQSINFSHYCLIINLSRKYITKNKA